MSLEDEAMEFFSVYHGQREYVEQLEQGIHDCHTKIEQLEQLVREYALWVAPMETTVKSGECIPESWWQQKRALQHRANALLGQSFKEPLEGMSGI